VLAVNVVDKDYGRRSMVAVRRSDARLGGGVLGRRFPLVGRWAGLLAVLAAGWPVAAAEADAPGPSPPPGPAATAPSPELPATGAASPDAASAPGTPAPTVAPSPAPEPAQPTAGLPVPPPSALPPAAPDAPPPPAPSWLSLPPLQIHAFVGQGYIRTTKNNYLVQDSTRGSFEFTEVGVNFTQSLTDNLRTGIQLFARQLGKDGDFRARMDWFYLDYRFADWLGLRAGRTKIPFGLYNEVNDIDSARVPILLPQAVYPIINRNILLAQTGAELYGYLALGQAGGLEYRIYGGTLFADPPVLGPGAVLNKYEARYLAGARLLWETPLDGLRVGGNVQALRLDTNLTISLPSGMPLTIEEDVPFRLWLASAEYAAHDLLLAAEFGHWHADVDITGMPQASVTNQRFYGMASYRIAPWFSPGVYYSSLLTDEHKPLTRDNYQHDLAATLRFDINPYWLLKLEGHYIDGTTDIQAGLNGSTALEMLARQWFLFLIKTTAYF